MKKMHLHQPHRRHVVLDVETTGLSPRQGHRVIEIGAVAIEDGKIIEEFHTLVNPGKRISLFVQEINGITNEMLRGKPTPEEVMPTFKKFIGESILVAHNAPFDMSFIANEFDLAGIEHASDWVCTLQISRALFPGLRSHKLEKVCMHVLGDISGVPLHRALADARLTARLWLEMAKKLPKD